MDFGKLKNQNYIQVTVAWERIFLGAFSSDLFISVSWNMTNILVVS